MDEKLNYALSLSKKSTCLEVSAKKCFTSSVRHEQCDGSIADRLRQEFDVHFVPIIVAPSKWS